MSAFGDGERALIARSVAALRRHGWPAGRALMLVAERLPEGAARDELIGLVFALERGEALPASADLLGRLLVVGEAAGAGALLEAVRGFELRERASRATRGARILGAIALAGAAILAVAGSMLSSTMARMFADFGGSLPALTKLALDMGRLGLWAVPILIVAAALVLWPARVIGRLPGVRGLSTAASLRLYSAAIRAGIPEAEALALIDPSKPASFQVSKILGLDRYEQLLARRLSEREGSAHAARVLADEREASAAGTWALFLGLAPVAGFFALLLVLGPFIVGMYLPIFSISGAIQ